MDVLEMADEQIRVNFEIGQARMRAQVVSPVATGKCLHCKLVLDDDRRWCDCDCRDTWELRRNK